LTDFPFGNSGKREFGQNGISVKTETRNERSGTHSETKIPSQSPQDLNSAFKRSETISEKENTMEHFADELRSPHKQGMCGEDFHMAGVPSSVFPPDLRAWVDKAPQ